MTPEKSEKVLKQLATDVVTGKVDVCEMAKIVSHDPGAAPKMMKYVSWWAVPDGRNT